MTTRFLTTCISSHLFTRNGQTLLDLHTAVADDAIRAFYEGVEVTLFAINPEQSTCPILLD